MPPPVGLSKLSDAVKNYVLKKTDYNAKITEIESKILDIINPLMTAPLRTCLIFLKFCVLDNFRLIISWAKNEVCSIVGKHVFWPSHICDTGHITIQSCNNMLYLYTKFWLVLTQDMFFMFCMIYLVCSLVKHIYDKGHIGFNI